MKEIPRLKPVTKMCNTCPFKENSPYANLRDTLTESALTTTSRICHNTGNNAIHPQTGKPEKLCRGARDIQLKVMHALKVITEPTDEAWEAECKNRNI
jgi:hypothetical protein